MADKEITRKEFEAQLIRRAAKDPAFRELLLTNPKAAIEQEFGEKIPESFQIYVHEETANAVHIVLPWNPFSSVEDELAEEELEQVAGGELHCAGMALSTVLCTGR